MAFLDDSPKTAFRLGVAAISLICADAHAAPKETVLASLTVKAGAYPVASLIRDKAGNLYGTASYGGNSTSASGTVFKLSPPAAGKTAWTETVLVDFDGKNGQSPSGNLIADRDGNLYGTLSCSGQVCACGSLAITIIQNEYETSSTI